MPRISHKASQFNESIIRDMTRQILLHHPTDGVNLAQSHGIHPDVKAADKLRTVSDEGLERALGVLARQAQQ